MLYMAAMTTPSMAMTIIISVSENPASFFLFSIFSIVNPFL